MKQWMRDYKKSPAKKAIPVLSFPSVQLLGVGVKELTSSSDLQARGMKLIADRVDSGASLSMMDLSVEAEVFGSEIVFSDNEVPTVSGHIIETEKDADALAVPRVGAGRTGIYIEAIEKACKLIRDRPVFAGVIGPFSLAGRILDVTTVMLYCYDEPAMVHTVLAKVTEFLINYINAYKAIGAHGAVVAEPLAGLLSPDLNMEFSAAYMKQITEAVSSEDFSVIYHNCAGGTIKLIDGIMTIGADAYHFGNAIDMKEMLRLAPEDAMVMGNISPAGEFRNGTPGSIRKATLDLLEGCHTYPNFIISSGCDIPPMSSWENIDAFFKAVRDFAP